MWPTTSRFPPFASRVATAPLVTALVVVTGRTHAAASSRRISPS